MRRAAVMSGSVDYCFNAVSQRVWVGYPCNAQLPPEVEIESDLIYYLIVRWLCAVEQIANTNNHHDGRSVPTFLCAFLAQVVSSCGAGSN